MGKSNTALYKIIMNILKELYENSTPKGNFDELVNNAPVMEDGRKYIPFNDYEIEKDIMKNIVNCHMKAHRLSKYEQDIVRCEVYLGPSPRIKMKKEEEYE